MLGEAATNISTLTQHNRAVTAHIIDCRKMSPHGVFDFVRLIILTVIHSAWSEKRRFDRRSDGGNRLGDELNIDANAANGLTRASRIPLDHELMIKHSALPWLTVLTVLACSMAFLQSLRADDVTHSFLAVGKAARTVIVGEDGQVQWKLEMAASDGWVLPNGNVLLALYGSKTFPQGGIVEVERESKRIVFQYKGRQRETSTVQLLPNGNFLLAELGPKPRAVEINRAGEVMKSTPLACQKKNFHMQTRMLRMLPNGRYIAPHLLDFAVKEYEPESGKVLAVFPTDDRGRDKRDWPFTAIRLDNGNTLIGCTNGNRVIEIDENGKIVWSVTNEDLGEALLNDACGVQRLPNGNTVITSFHAKGDEVKLLEVTRDKKVVWRFSGYPHGFHHFQILTTNGKPLSDNTMK